MKKLTSVLLTLALIPAVVWGNEICLSGEANHCISHQTGWGVGGFADEFYRYYKNGCDKEVFMSYCFESEVCNADKMIDEGVVELDDGSKEWRKIYYLELPPGKRKKITREPKHERMFAGAGPEGKTTWSRACFK